jgi:tripartite-type tricarboxylate transporter receptor subunit TctC
MVLVVNPAKVPATNAGILVALLKAKPGQLQLRLVGNGTILHLAAEMFLDEAAGQGQAHPLQGRGPMVTDLIGGQVDWACWRCPACRRRSKAARCAPSACCRRAAWPAAPEIPTIAEQGLPNYNGGRLVRRDRPGQAAAGRSQAHPGRRGRRLRRPAVKEAMAKQGNTINPGTPEAAAQFFRSEMVKSTERVVITEVTMPQGVSTSISDTTSPRMISLTLPRNWLRTLMAWMDIKVLLELG